MALDILSPRVLPVENNSNIISFQEAKENKENKVFDTLQERINLLGHLEGVQVSEPILGLDRENKKYPYREIIFGEKLPETDKPFGVSLRGKTTTDGLSTEHLEKVFEVVTQIGREWAAEGKSLQVNFRVGNPEDKDNRIAFEALTESEEDEEAFIKQFDHAFTLKSKIIEELTGGVTHIDPKRPLRDNETEVKSEPIVEKKLEVESKPVKGLYLQSENSRKDGPQALKVPKLALLMREVASKASSFRKALPGLPVSRFVLGAVFAANLAAAGVETLNPKPLTSGDISKESSLNDNYQILKAERTALPALEDLAEAEVEDNGLVEAEINGVTVRGSQEALERMGWVTVEPQEEVEETPEPVPAPVAQVSEAPVVTASERVITPEPIIESTDSAITEPAPNVQPSNVAPKPRGGLRMLTLGSEPASETEKAPEAEETAEEVVIPKFGEDRFNVQTPEAAEESAEPKEEAVAEVTNKPEIPKDLGQEIKKGPQIVKPSNTTLFLQTENKWKGPCFDQYSACGPTAGAMAAARVGIDSNPASFYQRMVDKSLKTCGESMSYMSGPSGAIQRIMVAEMGFERRELKNSLTLREIQDVLDEGGQILASLQRTPWVKDKYGNPTDHIFMLDGTNFENGKVKVSDPFIGETWQPLPKSFYWAEAVFLKK